MTDYWASVFLESCEMVFDLPIGCHGFLALKTSPTARCSKIPSEDSLFDGWLIEILLHEFTY